MTIRHGKHKDTIQISFTYRGVECRETLKNLDPTPANLKFAARHLGEIRNAIDKGAFTYGEYFPDSKRARMFGHVAASQETVGQRLTAWIERVESSQGIEESTASEYRTAIEGRLMPAFGSKLLTELTSAHIREWITDLTLTAKTIRNLLIPLRAVLEESVNDGVIARNPMATVIVKRLVKRETAKSDYEVDPFDGVEREKLLANTSGQIHNLFKFLLFSGLRPSEWIALEWTDIDFDKGVVTVDKAVVRKRRKGTKTAAGRREVLMLAPARQALEEQKAITEHLGTRVFRKPQSLKEYTQPGDIMDAWRSAIKRAKLRYRNPYQMRHTYASMLLSGGENLMWVATQMGHVDTEMLIKVYGKWIPDHTTAAGYVPVGNYGTAEGDKLT